MPTYTNYIRPLNFYTKPNPWTYFASLGPQEQFDIEQAVLKYHDTFGTVDVSIFESVIESHMLRRKKTTEVNDKEYEELFI